MATITKPNTFASGATIASAEVNSNFDTIYNEFNGSIDNDNIKAGAAIALTKLAAAAWTDYTPTWTTVVKGSATEYSKYVKIGRLVVWRYHIVFAADSTFGSGNDFALTLPVEAASKYSLHGEVFVHDAGTAYRSGQINPAQSTTSVIKFGTPGGADIYDNTKPQTWTTGDELGFTLIYESAS